MKYITAAFLSSIAFVPALAQPIDPGAAASTSSYPQPKRRVNHAGEWMQGKLMPANTMITVTPMEEISSKHIKEGQAFRFVTVGDTTEKGFVVIPRGSPVTGVISWKTGRAIGGKSGKFDVEFRSVQVNGREMMLTGKHHQEGRGNTAAALFGSMIVTGRSAVMIQGQTATAFTAEPIPY
jgi:hypothetical protein